MVNIYCEHLHELKILFSQLVFFGLLEEDDAQCFLVEASPEIGFFLLATGSIILALLNTFVTKAAIQYLRDKDMSLTKQDLGEPFIVDKARELIEPPVALFTDRFRWLLVRDDVAGSSSGHISSSSSLEDTDVFDSAKNMSREKNCATTGVADCKTEKEQHTFDEGVLIVPARLVNTSNDDDFPPSDILTPSD
jgi:hypothetical protein